MTAALDLDQATGLERARRRAEGAAPLSRVHATFGLHVAEVGRGSATARCALSPWLVDASGYIAAGVAAVVADSAMGTALLTTLPANRSCMTSQLRVDHLAPIVVCSGELSAIAHVEDVTSPSPYVVAEVYDGAGVRIASASARCMSVIGHGELVEPVVTAGPGVAAPGGDEALEAWKRGVAPPPLHAFLRVPAGPAADELAFPVGLLPGFANVFGGMQGGALALIAGQALAAAARTTCREGEDLAPVDLHVTYLRPAVADEVPLVVRSRIVRSGARVVDVSGEMCVDTGVAAVVRGSFLRVQP